MRYKSKRTRAVLTTIVAVSLVTAAVGGWAADNGNKEGQVEVLELNVENDQYASLDLGQPGASVGDMDVYSGNAIKDGRKVGHGGGSCQVINMDGENMTMQCLLTMEFDRGSVTMQSLWTRGENPLDMAITGGTGVYRNARGTVRFWDIATPNERVRAEIIL